MHVRYALFGVLLLLTGCVRPPAALQPTALAPPLAYPTYEALPWQLGSDRAITLLLPSAVIALDLAVHPTDGWPAVAAVVWSGDDDPERVMLSVYQPHVRRWSSAHQVDLGPSRIGRYQRTVAVGISGDGTIHVLWGMSDPHVGTGDPPAGLWASRSDDFGATWAAPVRIATACQAVTAVAVGVDGTLVAQLICSHGSGQTLAMVTRRADGSWQLPELLHAPVQFFSEGALLISGEEHAARVTGLLFAEQGGVPFAYLLSRDLTGGAAWRLERLSLTTPTAGLMSRRMWHVHGLSYTRPQGPALSFSWSDAETGYAFLLTSLDGGRHWGTPELIGTPFTGSSGRLIDAVIAYDPLRDRLAAIWDCCDGGLFSTVATTHYASWSLPGSGLWQRVGGDPPMALALGSRSVGRSVGAQAANSSLLWLAWIERSRQVEVRSLDLAQIVPPVEGAP